MRIVIEIDRGEEQAAAALPSTITINFPPAAGQPDASVFPDAGREAVADLTADDQEAGAAPDIDQAPDEPAVFVQPGVAEADAPAIESEAIDAGPAPADDLTEDESTTFAVVTAADSEDMDAGTAPDDDMTEGEPSTFVSEAGNYVTAANSENMDAGAAPDDDMTESELSAYAQPDDQAATAADSEDMDAGTAAIDHLLQDESDVIVSPAAGDDQGIGFPAEDAGAAPAVLFADEFSEEVASAAPDDLTAISGIGPKIAGVLMASGITTYDQLAACSMEDLHQLVADAGISSNVDTWLEQAQALR